MDGRVGSVNTHIFHHAIEAYALYQHASSISFYHAQQATGAMRRVVKQHYK